MLVEYLRHQDEISVQCDLTDDCLSPRIYPQRALKLASKAPSCQDFQRLKCQANRRQSKVDHRLITEALPKDKIADTLSEPQAAPWRAGLHPTPPLTSRSKRQPRPAWKILH